MRCEANQNTCELEVSLIDDDIPEETNWFLVVLTEVTDDAKLNTEALVANVTVRESDHIRGLIEFVEDSQYVILL